jgi:diketogulonate reductase-like aldo/keto reductase
MQTVKAMQALVASGKVRTWGVSNWQVRDLEQMHDAYGFYPAINQSAFNVQSAAPARCARNCDPNDPNTNPTRAPQL